MGKYLALQIIAGRLEYKAVIARYGKYKATIDSVIEEKGYVDNTCHSAFVSYDIMGKDTIKMWVASTAEDMSQNRTFKVRCVVVGY